MELLLKVYVNPFEFSPYVEVVVGHHIEHQLGIKPIFVFVFGTSSHLSGTCTKTNFKVEFATS